MKNTIARAVAQRQKLNQEAFVGLWSTALWVLAAIYLYATVYIH